jgi:uncharacterized protein
MANFPEPIPFLFAHGAGAPMDSPFMQVVADGLGAHNIRVVRFEFSYMAARRTGKRPGPSPLPLLQAELRAQYIKLGTRAFIGGKSMGARVASLMADELGALGVICFGYPFFPPKGGSGKNRTQHLAELKTRALILQGTRDPFGGPEALENLPLRPHVHWIADGDHDLAPRKKSGRTHTQNLDEAISAAATWMRMC